MMTKEQISEQLDEWIESGALFSKMMIGDSYYKIYRKVSMGQYYATKHPSVYAVNKDIADMFNAWFDAGIIMSAKTALERHREYASRNDINKACMNGIFLKYGGMKGISIYICDAV